MSAPSTEPHDKNPFPGLRPFTEEEEHLFFGRENQVDAMVDKLAATHFLAVVGTSGSGKSSLVNCGLRPALSRGLMARAGTSWRIAQFRPGNDPIGAMAGELAKNGVLFRDYVAEGLPLSDIIETTLRMSRLGLIDIFKQAKLGEGVNLLIVADQFEELFRYQQLGTADGERDRAEQMTAFVNLLLEIRERAPERIFVVLTMRSDFLGDCTHFPGLPEAINAGQYLVPRLTRDERRAAIEGPIQVAGAEISPVLLTTLVNDVGDNPDQLSILQHALNRTWAYWKRTDGKNPLDLADYKAIGTMEHALDEHAKRAYGELTSPRQQQICEKMFKALTDKTDPRGVRRPTMIATLCALTDATAAEVTEVANVFRKPSRSFLMPPMPGEPDKELDKGTVVDISHESLMRVWKQLNVWADEEARSAGVYRRLAETAAEFSDDEEGLYRGPQLQIALAWRERDKPNETWAARYHAGFAQAMTFLDQSRAKRDADLDKEKRRSERELRKARVVAGVMAAFSLVATGLVIFAYRSYLDAQASRLAVERTRARMFAEAASREPMDKAKTILLALESLPDGASSNPEVVNRPLVPDMQESLSKAITGIFEVAVLSGHSGTVNSVAVTPDGKRIVSGSDDSTALVWDVSTRKVLFTLAHKGAVLAVAVTPDGQHIITASADQTAKVWSASTGANERELPAGREGRVLAVAVTPDSTHVVTGSEDGVARIWDVKTGALERELNKHDKAVTGVAVMPDGKSIVTASEDRTARVWDAGTGEVLQRFTGHKAAIRAVAVIPDGTRAITSSWEERSVRLWDPKTGEERLELRESGTRPRSVTVVPHSRLLLVGWDDTTVRMWRAYNDGEVFSQRLKGHEGGVSALAVMPDGTIVTGSDDKTVRLWNFKNSNSPPKKLDSPEASQALVDLGKEVVPRCLTIKQRQELTLGPRPPDWCIDRGKYPYDLPVWKDWKGGKAVQSTEIAELYADFADKALKGGGDLKVALETAKISIEFDKPQVWLRVNLAHAEMFLGQTKAARTEYLSHCGTKLPALGDISWEKAVLNDFSELRSKNRYDPLMDDVEKKFGEQACLPNHDDPQH